jgi:alkanesulfonate monooxygenase SsuD/methylene tetrahydromethanopterin reductase-like flavin-dependent oxidoreductase (luciferase family)
MTALAYAASHSERLQLGPLVAPLSLRDPVQLLRQAVALDDLSGGRVVLGVGAGWNEREHAAFGYALGDVPTRLGRLAEGLEVVARLAREPGPVKFEGRFYRLDGALLRPRRAGGPRILVGGNGPRRTLPLVARYADVWNATRLLPEEFRERSAVLDGLLRAFGREPTAVKRTLMTLVIVASDDAELERRTRWFRTVSPSLAAASIDEVLTAMRRQYRNLVVGAPREVAAQLRGYANAGVEELMLDWFDLDDLESLASAAAIAQSTV